MELSSDRSKWGRARFGEGRMPAMGIAIPIGVVLAIVVGFFAVWTGIVGPRPLVGGAVFAIVMASPFIALAWVLVVDRDTLQGATERPEESVENTWLQAASSGSFFDLIAIGGLGAAILTFSGWNLSGQIAFVIVVLLGMASFSLRYLIASRRG